MERDWAISFRSTSHLPQLAASSRGSSGLFLHGIHHPSFSSFRQGYSGALPWASWGWSLVGSPKRFGLVSAGWVDLDGPGMQTRVDAEFW